MSTDIEWADEVWNPTTGCTPVSEGCRNCYAATFSRRGLTEAHRGLTVMRDGRAVAHARGRRCGSVQRPADGGDEDRRGGDGHERE